MISRPDLLGILALAAFSLGGCGEGHAEPAGIERVRAQIAAGDVAAAQLTIDNLLEEGAPKAELAALAGEAALDRGDLDKAREWLGSEDFAAGSAAHGYRMLSRLELQENDFQAGALALEQARRLAPADASVWVDIGRLRYRVGDHLAALEAAEKAIQLEADNLEALRFRGQLARDSDGMAPAAKWFAKARELAPHDEGLRLEHAAALLDAGDVPQAVSVLDEKSSDDAGSFYLQAVAAARSGAYFEARELLERSGDERRATAAAQMLSAVLDLESGNLKSAAQTLDRLSENQPDNSRVHDLLAYVLSSSGAHDELIYRYAARAAGAQGSTWLRTLVGRAYEAIDQRDQAAIYLDLAARPAGALALLRPSEVAASSPALARRNAIRSLASGGDTNGGVRLARQFAQEFNGSADAAALLGDALLADDQKGAALGAYEKAAKVRKSWPLILRMAATMDRDDAAKLIASFAAANPNNAVASALAADAYAAAGQWEEAARLLDRAIVGGMRRTPWVLASRSVASGKLGDPEAQLAWAIEAYELQRMNEAAIAALIDALPPSDQLRAELEAKQRALLAR